MELHRCGTCGNHIQEDQPVIRVENKYRRASVQFFHADHTGCAEAEERGSLARSHNSLDEEFADVLDAI